MTNSTEGREPYLTPEQIALVNHPILQSLLYDINLLPAQLITLEHGPGHKHWGYMLAVIGHFKMALSSSPERVAVPETLNLGHIGDFIDEYADEFGVERFQTAMLEKLEWKRMEGRGGWNRSDECSVDELWSMLRKHIGKGDPVDIANFAMMIWNRENPISHPAPPIAASEKP